MSYQEDANRLLAARYPGAQVVKDGDGGYTLELPPEIEYQRIEIMDFLEFMFEEFE